MASRSEREVELQKMLNTPGGSNELQMIHSRLNEKLVAAGKSPLAGAMMIQEILEAEFEWVGPRPAGDFAPIRLS